MLIIKSCSFAIATNKPLFVCLDVRDWYDALYRYEQISVQEILAISVSGEVFEIFILFLSILSIHMWILILRFLYVGRSCSWPWGHVM